MQIKKIIKENYKFIILLILLGLFFNLHLPYYVMAPGGTINITDRVEKENYHSNGSINMLYVSEYKATPSNMLFSKIMGYDILKNDTKKISNESIEEANNREKIMRDNSLDIALMVAYNKAQKYIKINSEKAVVIATTEDNNLHVGDIILEADNKNVTNVDEIKEYISTKNVDDIITFKVLRDNKPTTVKSKIREEKNRKVVGVVIITDYDYEIDPQIDLKFKNRESGSSGGLMLTLTVYNAISDKDIIKGRNIAGTGTISPDGTVGEIDGVKYKIMGAKKMDVVFVPSANYKEALKTKKKYHSDMELVKVDTFDEVLAYLDK